MPKKKVIDEVVKQAEERHTKKKEAKSPGIKAYTGATLLDCVVGGGYPFGSMIQLYGDSQSGKTYMAIECIAHARQTFGKKLKWFYDDAEAGFNFDTQSMYGFEMLPKDKEDRSDTIEEFASRLKRELNKLKKDELLIYVVDSFDGLGSEAEKVRDAERQKAFENGKVYEKGTFAMEKQKFASEFFRNRIREIRNKNCLLIVISQVRTDIGKTFGDKDSVSGGKALKFYSTFRIKLSEVEKVKKKKRDISATIKAKAVKARIHRPFRECFINLIFDYGIDNIGSNIDFLYDLKTEQGREKLKKDQKKVEWDGKEYSRNKLIQHIEENDLEEELIQRVKDEWDRIEDSIATKRKDKWVTKIDSTPRN